MGMIGFYRRVTPGELRQLQSDPDSIQDFLYPPEEESARYQALMNNQPLPGSRNFDVDKSWQAIHFLLCGSIDESEPPLGNAVLGGEVLGDVDLGYGPPRYLTSGEVKDVSQALAAIDIDEFMSRFDYETMIQEGALFSNTSATEDEEREYVRSHYPPLQSYFREAADAGDAMILWIG